MERPSEWPRGNVEYSRSRSRQDREDLPRTLPQLHFRSQHRFHAHGGGILRAVDRVRRARRASLCARHYGCGLVGHGYRGTRQPARKRGWYRPSCACRRAVFRRDTDPEVRVLRSGGRGQSSPRRSAPLRRLHPSRHPAARFRSSHDSSESLPRARHISGHVCILTVRASGHSEVSKDWHDRLDHTRFGHRTDRRSRDGPVSQWHGYARWAGLDEIKNRGRL